MNQINYQKKLDAIIETIADAHTIPTLLLHSCCAPCSSYCLEYLSQYFSITIFYYNPNIFPEEEYWHRVKEQKEFIRKFPAMHPVSFVEGAFDTDSFYAMAKGHEQCREGGERCFLCYELRLRRSAELARELQMDYFTTTLTISPLKNAQKLNEIGKRLEKEYGVNYLVSDFKKRSGYKRSTELSREYGMYRQDYCGCVYSLKEKEKQKKEAACDNKKVSH